MSTTFKNSYIITARNSPLASQQPDIFPLPDGKLWFDKSGKPYSKHVLDYQHDGPASATPPETFLKDLTADLQVAIANGCPQLTVIVHGLGNLFSDVDIHW